MMSADQSLPFETVAVFHWHHFHSKLVVCVVLLVIMACYVLPLGIRCTCGVSNKLLIVMLIAAVAMNEETLIDPLRSISVVVASFNMELISQLFPVPGFSVMTTSSNVGSV